MKEAMSSLKTSINSISTHTDTQEASPVNMDHSKMQLKCTPFSFFLIITVFNTKIALT